MGSFSTARKALRNRLKTGITVEAFSSELAAPPIHDLLHAGDGVGNEMALLTDTRVILLRHPTVPSLSGKFNDDSGSSVFG
ncbi:MAG: hypothetical protein CMM01_22710 [Rhodopirellula sp.]|nr:hypothetical protein [Rhodopirellula sp.]